DVAVAVAVEVTGAGHRPRAWHGAKRTAADLRRTVHQPDQRLAGGALAPEDVGKAIAVEVALSDDRPARRHRTRRTAAGHARAADQPHNHLPARGVDPEDVAVVLAAEIVGSGEHDRRLQPPDLVAGKLGEPQVVIRPQCDAEGNAVAGGNR